MRLLVFGNSGSGKTTYARGLVRDHGLPHLDLDSIVWEPDRIAVQRAADAILESLDEFLSANTEWVIEGCYGELVKAAAPHCSELVFLNPGLDVCQAHNRARPWEPAKYESLEQQNSYLADLQKWVEEYYTRDGDWSYRAHRTIFDDHLGPKTELT
ncbi:MAG: shikimate kinase [Gemmatimonadota bacterium]